MSCGVVSTGRTSGSERLRSMGLRLLQTSPIVCGSLSLPRLSVPSSPALPYSPGPLGTRDTSMAADLHLP